MAQLPLSLHTNPETLEAQAPAALDAEPRSLRQMLEAAGAPGAVLDHCTPYSDADAPYLYTGRGPHVVINGSGGQAADGSEARFISDLMVATDRPIGEVVTAKYDDQTSAIRAQWRSRQYHLKPGSPRHVEREEIQQVGAGVFVSRHYRGVSDLGAFDGELRQITLLVQSERFHPASAYPGRVMFRRFAFYCTEDGFTADRAHVSGATLLNGVQELCSLDLADIHVVRSPAGALEQSARGDTENVYEPSLVKLPDAQLSMHAIAEQAAAEHPEIIAQIREYMTQLAPQALGQLARPGTVNKAIESFTNGVLKHPDLISVLGVTLDQLDPNARFKMAQILAGGGQAEFSSWYQNNLTPDGDMLQPELVERIITLNLTQFAEAWNRRTNGVFSEPDYGALQRDIALLVANNLQGLLYGYPLTSSLFYGIQTATVAVFIEDYLANLPDLRRALEAKL